MYKYTFHLDPVKHKGRWLGQMQVRSDSAAYWPVTSMTAASAMAMSLTDATCAATTIPAPSSNRRPDPLAAARARGGSYIQQQFDDPSNLSLTDAQTYSGRAEAVIKDERNRGLLYALAPQGAAHGYRYPKWQFDVPASRLAPVLDILVTHGMSAWAIHHFLTRPNTMLGGRRPCEAIGDIHFSLPHLIDVVQTKVAEHQGAA
jgi:hypothetical protein